MPLCTFVFQPWVITVLNQVFLCNSSSKLKNINILTPGGNYLLQTNVASDLFILILSICKLTALSFIVLHKKESSFINIFTLYLLYLIQRQFPTISNRTSMFLKCYQYT